MMRRCLREPIPELFHAAHLLDRAVSAHLRGHRDDAARFIASANMPRLRAYWDSLCSPANRKERKYLTPKVAKEDREPVRMPEAAIRRQLLERYGYNCAFCGVPLIRAEIRKALQKQYPDVLPWGKTVEKTHLAFLCLWLQYDHLLPHSRGGNNSPDNIAITCGTCNYGREDWTLEEMNLLDPRTFPHFKTSWDGLERLFA